MRNNELWLFYNSYKYQFSYSLVILVILVILQEIADILFGENNFLRTLDSKFSQKRIIQEKNKAEMQC